MTMDWHKLYGINQNKSTKLGVNNKSKKKL